MRFKLLLTLVFASSFLFTNAQCESGEVPVHVEVDTDNWGYELYWEVTPAGNECGDGTLFYGGNIESVACTAEDAGEAGDAGAYADNDVILEGPYCLTDGEQYTLHSKDGFGDGGCDLTLFNNLVAFSVLEGEGDYVSLTFTAGEAPEGAGNQLPCGAEEITVDGEGALVDNTGALTQLGEIHPPLESCGLPGFWCASDNGVNASIWLKFVAPESGRVEVSTCNEDNSFDTELALYEVGDCANFETYQVISSNDDVPGGCDLGSTGYASVMNVSCLTPGEEYWIQLDGWGGSSGETRVTVTDLGESPTAPSLNVISNEVQCFGEANGSLITEVFDYGVNYDVTISGPNGFEADSYFVDGLESGEYTVTVSSGCGLNITETVEISEPEPFLIASQTEDAGCNMSGEIVLSIDGATPPYEFTWFFDQVIISEEQNLTDLEAGEYTYQLEDDNGCETSGVVTVETGDAIDIELGEDTTLCLNQELLLFAPPGAIYEWQDGSENQFFVVDASELGPGEYTFSVNGVDNLECEDSDEIVVTVEDCISSVGELNENQVSMYPNPALEQVELEVNGALQRLEITDSHGRIVYSQEEGTANDHLTIDVSDFEAGLYFVKLFSESNQVVKKLMVR
ncbi:T9SS type A sorting domain-containing protein [Halocola ammonii]